MRKSLIAVVAALCWLCPGLAVGQEEAPAIPFSEETLPNGLRVIYAPLDDLPTAQVRMVYRVESRDDPPGRRGMAHLFEHMMFRGSAHVDSGMHQGWLTDVGGAGGAYTSQDATVYHNTVPAHQVELALWLEADRMAGFTVTDDVFVTERRIVEEEWRRAAANPNEALWNEFHARVFARHPYRESILGDMEELRQATVAELDAFHRHHYRPGNAALVIAGAFDEEAVRTTVRRYFAWIPAGPSEPPPASERALEAKTLWVESFEAARAESPLHITLSGGDPVVMKAFPMPERGADDYPAGDALVLFGGWLDFGGGARRLAETLTVDDKPLCSYVSVGTVSYGDGRLFTVRAALSPGADPERVEALLNAELSRLAREGVPLDEWAAIKRYCWGEAVERLQTAEDVANALGIAWLRSDRPEQANEILERIEEVTLEHARQAVCDYLSPECALTVYFVPDPEYTPRTLPPDARDEDKPVATEPRSRMEDLPSYPDDFPRTPPFHPTPSALTFEQGVEAEVNGVRVVTYPDHRLPVALLQWVFPVGSDTLPPDQATLGDQVAEWVMRGPAGGTPEAFAKRLEVAGVVVEVEDEGDHIVASAYFNTDALGRETALSALRDILNRPALDPEEWARIVVSWSGGPETDAEGNRGEDAEEAADRALHRLMHNEGDKPSPAPAEPPTLEQAKAYYASHYLPGGVLLVASGDVTPEEAAAWVAILGGDPGRERPAPAAKTIPAPSSPRRRVVLLDHPRDPRAVIRLGQRTYPADGVGDEDEPVFAVANALLRYRLTERVSDELGLTYLATSSFAAGPQGPTLTIALETGPETAGRAASACLEVVRALRAAPLTPAELHRAAQRASGAYLLALEPMLDRARARLQALRAGHGPDYVATFAARMAAVDADDLHALFQRYADPDRMALVVAGPAAVMRDQFAAFGPVEESP